MNVKNMKLHYSFPEDAKVKYSETIDDPEHFFREAVFVPY